MIAATPDAATTGGQALLRGEDLVKHYADGDVTAVNHVSLTVPRGEYLMIMGQSGSGKSSLLNLLGALDRPTSGEVYFEGRPLSKIHDLHRLRCEKIGFVFQSFHLLPTLSALENVQIPMFPTALPPAKRAAKAKELLERVEMGDRINHLPRKLSVGQRQRVAIARALANDPILLLADEPTGNLDEKTGNLVLDLFGRLHREQQLTLVVITHNPEVALRAQRVIHIRNGKIDREEIPQPAAALAHSS